jgi:hypothetical protein
MFMVHMRNPTGRVWVGVCYWRLIACGCSCFKTHFVGIVALKIFSTECSYYKIIHLSFIQIPPVAIQIPEDSGIVNRLLLSKFEDLR